MRCHGGYTVETEDDRLHHTVDCARGIESGNECWPVVLAGTGELWRYDNRPGETCYCGTCSLSLTWSSSSSCSSSSGSRSRSSSGSLRSLGHSGNQKDSEEAVTQNTEIAEEKRTAENSTQNKTGENINVGSRAVCEQQGLYWKWENYVQTEKSLQK